MTVNLQVPEKDEHPQIVSAERPASSLPLSFAQQRLWLLSQDQSALNLQSVFRLDGTLRIEALQRAFGELLKRHESLRTRVEMNGGSPVQVVNEQANLPIEIVDFSSLDETHRIARVADFIQSDQEHPFDLAKAPPLRVSLLRLGANTHQLVVTMHCITADDRSMEILVRDVAGFYTACIEGRAPALPPVQMQYGEHVLREQDAAQHGLWNQELEYWKAQLAGSPPSLDLPTDDPRLPGKQFARAVAPFAFSDDLSLALSELAQKQGVTLFVLLLSAFQLLLGRYSGQKDILVGMPSPGRTGGKTENTIGQFENTLILRSDLSGDPAFPEFLSRMKELTALAQANQSLPLEKLLPVLQQSSDVIPQPLFQVQFILRDLSLTLKAPELSISMAEFTKSATVAELDLSLELQLQHAEIKGLLNYAPDLFSKTTITSFLGHFRTLLADIGADPGRRLSQFTLLDQAERRELLTKWNETAAALPARCIHELVAEQARKTPGAAAVLDERHQLTYSELEARSNRLAQHLRSLGVGPEVVVGLCVERSLEMVVGLLGILKAGGAYLPLDVSYPQDRLESMIQDSAAAYMVASPGMERLFPSYAGRWIFIDSSWSNQQIESCPDIPPESSVLPENLAYVIYTSGSTGRPKGVAVTHRSVVALLTWAHGYFRPEHVRTSLCATPISFDPSVLEIFVPLTSGGRAFVVESLFDLGKPAVRHEITMFAAAPSAMPALLEQGAIADSLKLIVLGSEKLHYSVAHSLKANTKIEVLQNVYGPTEDTLFSTTTPVELKDGRDPFLGHPISNTQVYVVDQHYEPTPVHITGEVYISGKGLARGYYRRPDLTAARFVPNPFGSGERMYETGDLARYREGMEIEFLGRRDQQVKIRGFRIELGEIEALMTELPEIRSAMVNAWEDSPGRSQLAAYLVPVKDKVPDLQEVRKHLGKRLPEYMMPGSFTILESLPTTASGKVDRRLLPKPAPPRIADEAAPATRQMTEMENKIAAIWKEVLRIDSIGLEQDFFELGGQSLLALISSSKLTAMFSQMISMKDHYTHRTVLQMAQAIDQGKAKDGAALAENQAS